MVKHYVVEHTLVGPHTRGAVIHFTEDHIKAGCAPEKLVKLGALREATEKELKHSKPYGTGLADESSGPIFPTVPFESTPPPGSVPPHTRSAHAKASSEGHELVDETGAAKGDGK